MSEHRHELHAALHNTLSNLKELETHARHLPNQNFADIVQSAHRRVTQLAEHPDLDAVHALATEKHNEPKPAHPFNPVQHIERVDHEN